PMARAGGKPFPERALLLFIGACVVILSLVMAAILLPILSPGSGLFRSRGSSVNTADEEADAAAASGQTIGFAQAQSYTYRVAITALESERRQDNQRAVLA
ncbi:MAG: sodium:proton antiporter, partial [Schleiferilactobacillus harbinensis]